MPKKYVIDGRIMLILEVKSCTDVKVYLRFFLSQIKGLKSKTAKLRAKV